MPQSKNLDMNISAQNWQQNENIHPCPPKTTFLEKRKQQEAYIKYEWKYDAIVFISINSRPFVLDLRINQSVAKKRWQASKPILTAHAS